MVRDDPDWLTFRKHELRFHPHHISSAVTADDVIDNLRREWRGLPDPRAYAQCLIDIENTLGKASLDFRMAEMILRREAPISLMDYEINLLYTAFQSQTTLFEALQSFMREQTRQRSNSDANTSRASLAWTEGLKWEALGRLLRIKTVWDRVRAMLPPGSKVRVKVLVQPGSQVQVQPEVQPQTPDDPGNGAGGEVTDKAQHEDLVDEDLPVQQPAQPDSGGQAEKSHVSDGRKRSRDEEDDHSGHGTSSKNKSPRTSQNDSTPAILVEPRSSDEIPLADLPPMEEEVDPQKEFEAVWMAFLATRPIPERIQWGKLFSYAKVLFRHTREAHHPNPDDISPEARENLRVTINKALERVIGWDWMEYVDKVKENPHGFYKDDEWRKAEQAREDAMLNSREGRDPIFPPRLIQPSLRGIENEDEDGDGDGDGDQAVFIDEDSVSDEMEDLAEEIPNGLLWEGDLQEMGVWKHLAGIGIGGQGQAGVWFSVRSDDHGMIIERIVVKSIYFFPTWDHASHWIENGFTNGASEFREKAMHAQLSSAGSSSGIVKYLGSNSKRTRRFLMRLYMEYCPHGDLLQLIVKHAKYDYANGTPMVDDDDNPLPATRIPIRALWSFFNDLAKAAFVMELGHDPTDSAAVEPPQWVEIVHRDIKPSNIFLAAPISKTDRGIPVCKLGDFGSAVPMEFDPLPNPEVMYRAGTKGWRAPEQQSYSDSEYRQELSSATNVWEIGRVMLALIELTHGFEQDLQNVRYDDDNAGEVLRSESEPQLRGLYGDELYDLVERCLQPMPLDRISAENLLQATQRQTKRLFEDQPPQMFDDDILEFSGDIRWGV